MAGHRLGRRFAGRASDLRDERPPHLVPQVLAGLGQARGDEQPPQVLGQRAVPVAPVLARRPAPIDGNTLSSDFTHSRTLILVQELGAVSAWTIAKMTIAGKIVSTAVLLGLLNDETRLPRVLLRAKALVSEVVSNGSRAATFLGECHDRSGQRVLVYAASELDPAFAAVRFASFVERHGLIDDTADKPVAKAAAKTKKLTVGVPASA